VGQIAKKQFLLIQHSKYSAMLSKVLSYRLLFQRFCPLGREEKKPSKEERNTNSFNIINIKTILLRKDRDYETLNSSERYDTLNKIYCCTLYLCLTFHKKIPVFLALTVQGKIGKTQKKKRKGSERKNKSIIYIMQ